MSTATTLKMSINPEIIAKILNASKKGCLKIELCDKKTDKGEIEEYLDLLLDAKLLKKARKSNFKTTKNGIKFLTRHQLLTQLLNNH